jgi:hypothetical protein
MSHVREEPTKHEVDKPYGQESDITVTLKKTCNTLNKLHGKVSQFLEAEMIYQICSKMECEKQFEGMNFMFSQ